MGRTIVLQVARSPPPAPHSIVKAEKQESSRILPTPPESPAPAPPSTAPLRRSRRAVTPAQHKGSTPMPLTAAAQKETVPAPVDVPAPGSEEVAPSPTETVRVTPSPAELDLPTLNARAEIALAPSVAVPEFARVSKDPISDLGKVFEAVARARRVAVVCGAGISVSAPANIPDFRSSEGLFRKLKEQHPDAGLSSGKDLFDARLFSSSKTTGLFYSMVSELKRMADLAQPTAFHHLLRMLDEQGRLLRVYTQNIDGLEAKAGLTFGLGRVDGDTGLGKRKRPVQVGGDTTASRRTFARSQSDSALLWNKPTEGPEPMFPRCIPLHGSLHTLTCSLCPCTLDLSGNGGYPPKESGATVLCAEDALRLLQQGEPVPCPRCEVSDEVRRANGLRSRGIGKMKVDVVLYGGQNESAERVGECLGRDLLGLRDPWEALVPESVRETQVRLKKEDKAQLRAATSGKDQRPQTLPRRRFSKTQSESCVTLSPMPQPKSSVSNGLDPVPETEDVFKSFFDAQELVQPKEFEPHKKRGEKLKPLPPDLLIVAGTSLKVPGTKRVVREFAKACHARDARWYPSNYSSAPAPGTAKRQANAQARGKVSASPSSSEADDAGYDSEEEYDRLPIRTMLINADFPHPSKEWAGVFDVWLQGDVQAAAMGLAPTVEASAGHVSHLSLDDFPLSTEDRGLYAPDPLDRSGQSWIAFKKARDLQRIQRAEEGRTKKGKRAPGLPALSSQQSNKVPMKGSQRDTTPLKQSALPFQAVGRAVNRPTPRARAK